MAKYSKDTILEVFRLYHIDGESRTAIGKQLDIPASSVYRMLESRQNLEAWVDYVNSEPFPHTKKENDWKPMAEFVSPRPEIVIPEPDPMDTGSTVYQTADLPQNAEDEDPEIIKENLRLAKRVQVLLDKNRIQNKSFREFARMDQMLVHQTEALLAVLKERSFEFKTVAHPNTGTDAPIGVIQMSDHHINEVVEDLESNQFDIHIASKRIHKHITKSLKYFKAYGVKKVLVAMTGDLIKNSQFISEITENSMDRANATILAVELYAQAILHINLSGFDVILAGVVGNESRIQKDFDTTSFLASESFDMMILKFLQIIFEGKPGVTVVPMENPLECVINVAGSNLLLVHGNAHGRLSNNSSIEKGVEVIKARYSALGVRIDYVIMGHIHSAYVGDNFARSSGLPGSNAYSERTLNLTGKASQNSYIFWKDGSIDGVKIDLQNVDGYEGYNLDKAMANLVIKVRNKAHSGTMNVIASYLV